jgi:hypothetical protein
MESLPGPLVGESMSSEGARRSIEPVNLGEIRGLQPDLLSYGGYLWAINLEGELYRFSGAANPEKYGALPGWGFSFPLTIEEDDKEGPVIYANNDKAIYKFRIFDKQHEEIFKLSDPGGQLKSTVLKEADNLYFLYRKGGNGGSLTLKCVGVAEDEYVLANLTLADTNTQPIQRIGKSLWVLTTEKILCFDGFALSAHTELPWLPRSVLPTKRGVWYAKKADSGTLGQKQTLMRVTSDSFELDESVLEGDVSVTARLAVNSEDGRLAVFSADSIRVFEFNKRRAGLLRGIVDVNNPEAALLISNLLFWFETEDRSVYLWFIGTHQVSKLSSFGEDPALSRLFYANGSLFGIAKEEAWRWDLLGA